MKKTDLDTTAAALAYVNSGRVPVLDVLSDPSALPLIGLQSENAKRVRENREEGDAETEKEAR